jgi:hypothetical protein
MRFEFPKSRFTDNSNAQHHRQNTPPTSNESCRRKISSDGPIIPCRVLLGSGKSAEITSIHSQTFAPCSSFWPRPWHRFFTPGLGVLAIEKSLDRLLEFFRRFVRAGSDLSLDFGNSHLASSRLVRSDHKSGLPHLRNGCRSVRATQPNFSRARTTPSLKV